MLDAIYFIRSGIVENQKKIIFLANSPPSQKNAFYYLDNFIVNIIINQSNINGVHACLYTMLLLDQ